VTVRFQRRAEQAAPSAGRRRSGVAQGRRVDARAPPGRTADVALDSILELVERREATTRLISKVSPNDMRHEVRC
jgi:hypothetical protein